MEDQGREIQRRHNKGKRIREERRKRQRRKTVQEGRKPPHEKEGLKQRQENSPLGKEEPLTGAVCWHLGLRNTVRLPLTGRCAGISVLRNTVSFANCRKNKSLNEVFSWYQM